MQIISLALLAAFSMRADAFAPASITSRAAGPLHMVVPSASSSDKPLTELCEITKEACEAVAPMLNGKWIVINKRRDETPLLLICMIGMKSNNRRKQRATK